MLRPRSFKRNKVILGALCATLALALALPPGLDTPASARERYRARKERIAPGLVLVRMYDRKIPNRIRVLRVEPSRELTLDTALANDRIPGHETTSSMATRKGAIAAINGDYTLLPSDPGAGRPVNLFATDGRLDASPLIWGRNFAMSYDEQSAYIGHPKFSATALQHDSGALWKIRDWNVQEPSGAGYAVHTPEGGSSFRTPENACSVRLAAPGTVAWNEDQSGVQQDLVVEAFRCHERRMARRGGIVLSAPIGTRQATTMQKSIAVGETLTLTWSTGWPGVVETIGGNPTLLEDGVITAEDCSDSYFCDRNPRTGVGVTPTGKVLLVTVDGRQKRSVGMTPVEFAKLMRHLGATWALNLDGGGSTTMWVEGGIVNRPSDNPERAVGSALLVLPGPDYEEPVPAPYPGVPVPSPSPSPSTSPSPVPSTSTSPSPVPSVSPSPSASAAEAASPVYFEPRTGFERALPLPLPARSPRCAALSDPGSTGGMLDALARGDFGSRVRLPRMLRRALDVYRGELSCDRFLGTTSSRR